MKTLKKWFWRLTLRAWSDIVEMPMYNWLKCQEGALRYVYKTVPRHETGTERKYWERLYDQFLERFGMPAELRDMLERMQAVTDANWDWILNPEDSLANTNKMAAELDYEALFTKDNKTGESKLVFVAAVEKYFGIEIDVKKTTVEQFYSRVEIMKTETKVRNGKENIQ